MKHQRLATLLTSLLIALPIYAAEENIPEGMANKAIRGAVDMTTGIVEFPMQIVKGYQKGFGPIENQPASKTVGTVLGFFRGISHSAARIGGGATELFGFWTANAESNEGVGVPFDAQYAWQTGEQYSYFDPSLKEGVKPVGRKLLHGAADTFVGIAELPGQIIKGQRDNKLLPGIGKGIWFSASRSFTGFSDLLLCLVPNHETTLGYPYSCAYPWEEITGK